jgi:hypothetical protein
VEAASYAHGVRVTIGPSDRVMPASPDHVVEAAEPSPFPEGEAPEEPALGADVVLVAAPLAESQEEPKAPAHSTRGAAPGLRGCWALNKHGDPCGAARRADGDYCNAHSGLGVAKDPAGWSAVGAAKSAEVRRRRATLRLAIGPTRLSTPRGVLRQAVFVEAERVAAAALDGAIDPAVPLAARAKHALKLIETVEPTAQVSVSTSLPSTPEGVAELSLSQLLELAQEHGIDPSPPPASMLLEQHGVVDVEG